MRSITAIAAILTPGAALADPGHFAELGGHSHWVAAGALALAGIIGAIALAKGGKDEAGTDAEEKPGDEAEA